MSTELSINFLGIRMDSRKAEGMRFTINMSARTCGMLSGVMVLGSQSPDGGVELLSSAGPTP
jgi:hypothetical protein